MKLLLSVMEVIDLVYTNKLVYAAHSFRGLQEEASVLFVLR